jgi:hypothetical protein
MVSPRASARTSRMVFSMSDVLNYNFRYSVYKIRIVLIHIKKKINLSAMHAKDRKSPYIHIVLVGPKQNRGYWMKIHIIKIYFEVLSGHRPRPTPEKLMNMHAWEEIYLR